MQCYNNSALASRHTFSCHIYTIHYCCKNILSTIHDLPVLLYTVIKPTVSFGNVKEWVEGTFQTIQCPLSEFCCCLKIFAHFANVRQLNESIYMIGVLIYYCLK
jgi:hypothetical protein